METNEGKAEDRVFIFDTTLRDGEQSPGASMNPDEKLRIARQLEKMGVDIVEAGFPVASEGDFASVRQIAREVRGCRIAALARANFADIDRAWEAVAEAASPRIHTFISSSDIHLQYQLKKSRSQVLEEACRAVAHASRYTKDVEFSPMDATRSDRDYLCQMVEAVIPGAEFPGEELVFTAHLYEGVAKQGANDNISGCVAILETARTLRKLMDDKAIPPLRRSVRFLFVPEISGTMAYIRMHPEISRRFFANINHDMVGEGLIKNQSLLELIQSPWSLPTYLNDVVRAFYEWMGTTQRNNEGKEAYLPVWSPTGSRDPFYYVIDPFSGGSDHQIFTHGGVRVPSAFMIVWPDQWYHTSGDTPDKSDSTQLKRVVVISAASAIVLAGAGPSEVERMAEEVGARGWERIGREKARAEALIREALPGRLHEAYREADNILTQAFLYEQDALDSIRFFLKGESRPESILRAQMAALAAASVPAARGLESIYRLGCAEAQVAPQKITLTAEEIRLGKIVPVPTDKMRGLFDAQAFAAARREMKDAPAYSLGRSESDIRNLIDGRRSLLRIRNAAAAHLPAVGPKDIESYFKVLERAGYVRLT
jgi:hypothetical protein